MAESFERKAGYRLQAQSQLIAPLLMLPMGILIAVVALSYFVPLSMLIRSLS
jgi:type II secretory pathway component PulF